MLDGFTLELGDAPAELRLELDEPLDRRRGKFGAGAA